MAVAFRIAIGYHYFTAVTYPLSKHRFPRRAGSSLSDPFLAEEQLIVARCLYRRKGSVHFGKIADQLVTACHFLKRIVPGLCQLVL